MPKFKVTASWPELDKERYLSDFREAIDKAMIKAARKFLLAAVPRIPIWTGMARGAMANLEDIAGQVYGGRIKGTRRGRVLVKNYRRPTNWYYYPPDGPRVLRTTQAGRQFATKPKDILNQGRLTKATAGSRVIFKYQVDITYFDRLDPGWGAFEAGREAFNAELKTQLDRLRPNIGKYLIRRELK